MEGVMDEQSEPVAQVKHTHANCAHAIPVQVDLAGGERVECGLKRTHGKRRVDPLWCRSCGHWTEK